MSSNSPFIFFCLVCFSLTAYTQTKYGIKHIYAFSREHIPGIVAVDKNGTPLQIGPDTINTIFMEISGHPAQWNTAWKNGNTYSIAMKQLTELPFLVGSMKEGDEEVILAPAKGNQLWRIDLELAEHNISAPKKMKPGEIMLRGKYGKQVIIQKIERQVMLRSIPSV